MKKFFIGFAILLVAIQLIRPARNESNDDSQHITTKHPASAETVAALQKACYDCHSNNTHYPWYANIQPIGWWLQHHVDEGKQHLNFSTFASYPEKRAKRKLTEIAESINEGWMPMESYLWMHEEAKLTAEEKKLIVDWVSQANQ